jgi:hypothetical protein
MAKIALAGQKSVPTRNQGVMMEDTSDLENPE